MAEQTAHTALAVAHEVAPSIELSRAAWLHEKRGRSDSAKTERAYSSTFDAFREALRAQGLDMDSDKRKVTLLAQAGAAAPRTKDGRPVTPATYNQRLAIISSFYVFARWRYRGL